MELIKSKCLYGLMKNRLIIREIREINEAIK